MEAFVPILIIVLLAVNGFISWLNCRTVGMAWRDVMVAGTWFEKLLLWCGATQSAIGFSMVLLFPGAFGLVAYFAHGSHPYINPDEATDLLKWVFSFWWLMVIIPCTATGTVIWVHSIRVAIQTRRWSDIAVATWNTFAQVTNMIDMFRHFGSAVTDSKSLFASIFKGDAKGKAGLALLVLALLCIVAGVLITFGLISHYARTSRSVVEEKLQAKRQ